MRERVFRGRKFRMRLCQGENERSVVGKRRRFCPWGGWVKSCSQFQTNEMGRHNTIKKGRPLVAAGTWVVVRRVKALGPELQGGKGHPADLIDKQKLEEKRKSRDTAKTVSSSCRPWAVPRTVKGFPSENIVGFKLLTAREKRPRRKGQFLLKSP